MIDFIKYQDAIDFIDLNFEYYKKSMKKIASEITLHTQLENFRDTSGSMIFNKFPIDKLLYASENYDKVRQHLDSKFDDLNAFYINLYASTKERL